MGLSGWKNTWPTISQCPSAFRVLLVMVGLCPKGGFCRSSWVSIYQACSRLSAFSRPCRWCPGIALLVRPVWRGWPLRGLRGVQYVVRVVVDLSFLRIVGGIVPLAWAGCRHIDAVIHDSYCTGLWTVPPEIRACGMGGQRCGDRLHLHGGSSASATLSTPAVGLMTWSPCCRFMWRHPGLGRNQVRRFSSAGSFLSEEIARGSRRTIYGTVLPGPPNLEWGLTPNLPRSRAGAVGPRPGTGMLSEDPGLAGFLLPFLGGSYVGLPLVLPVSQGAGLASGLVGNGGSAAFHTDSQELGLFPP